MKKEISLMKRWTFVALASALGLWAGPAVAGSEPAPVSEKAVASEKGAEIPVEEEPVVYNNWVEVGMGYNWVNGDGAQFQQRTGLPRDSFYGGIQDLHMEGALGGGMLTLDGRAIIDNGDYLLDIRYDDPGWGYVNFGISTYRSYYDGSAGFFPGREYDDDVEVDRWFDSFDDEMFIERGSIWFEGGLTLEDMPQVVFRYEHQWRHGRKDATIWGDSNLTGGYKNSDGGYNNYGTRAYVPAYRDIEESRDIFDLNITHAIGNTSFGLGGRLELLDQDNGLYLRRRPHEQGTVYNPENPNGTTTGSIDRRITQREGLDADLWNVHTFTDTTFNDQFKLTSGFSYTAMDTDVTGSRIIGDHYDDEYDRFFLRRQARDEGFRKLVGGAFLKQYVGNMSLMYRPFDDLVIVPAVRVEAQERDGVVEFIETNVDSNTRARPRFQELADRFRNMQNRQDFEVTESLEIRYTGIENFAFYISGEWSEGTTQLKESEYLLDEGVNAIWHEIGETELFRDTNSDRSLQKYTAGVNWYPHHTLSIGAQYYYKEKNIDYDFLTDWETYTLASTGDLYPSFIREQDFQTHDLNVRLTWRPWNFLTSVTRYDLQHSTIDTRGDFARTSDYDDGARALDSMESAQFDSHIFSQSLTIIPCQHVFIQANGSYTFDELETPVYGRELPGNNATSANAMAVSDAGYLTLVDQSRNSYWTAGVIVGVQFDPKTSLQAQYDYYLANNYVNSYFATMPYGGEYEESRVMATVNRQLTEQITLTMRYGFMNYEDVPSGGNNSYNAHLAYAGLKFMW